MRDVVVCVVRVVGRRRNGGEDGRLGQKKGDGSGEQRRTVYRYRYVGEKADEIRCVVG